MKASTPSNESARALGTAADAPSIASADHIAEPARAAARAPLAGIRVLDLTNVLSGPFCAYQLAQVGADVIKVELPGTGDLARQLGADEKLNAALMGASFLAQNAGKKSVTVNLKTEQGRNKPGTGGTPAAEDAGVNKGARKIARPNKNFFSR